MNILIINSPLYKNPKNQYDEVLPPIGLGYICTYLKKKGFNVELFDALAGKTSLENIVSYVEKGSFGYIGLNIFSTNYQLVKEIITKISKDVTFFVGGAFTKSNYKDIIHWETHNPINVVIGEGDYIISQIISGTCKEPPILQNGNKKVYKVDKDSQYFPKDISGTELDRSFFNYEPTISAANGQLECNIISSRGCIYDCTFCSAAISLNKDTIPRIRNTRSIKNELIQIKKDKPQVKSIRVLDDLFLRNSKSITDAIEIFSGLNLEWRAMAHIKSFKNIDHHTLSEMKTSGCSELSIGIESGNNEILQFIRKNNTRDEIIDTIKKILNVGIGVKGYFIVGFPNETYNQLEDTYTLAKNLKELSLDYSGNFRITVFQFRPYHGTQIYNELLKQGHNIGDIHKKNHIGHMIGEYDFGNGNFSLENDKNLEYFLEKIRGLNSLSKNFVPFAPHPNNFPQKEGVFFVGLSHKFGKKGEILEAFCPSTQSGQLINNVVCEFPKHFIYKTNLVKGVPLDDFGKIRYPNKKEMEEGIKLLMSEIENFNPKVVFLFGKQVSDFVVNTLQMTKINESEYLHGSIIFILSEHPSYISVYKRHKKDDYLDLIKEKIFQKF